MTSFMAQFVGLLFDSSLKGVVVGALAWLGLALMGWAVRRQPAIETRHHTWLLVLLAILAMPILTAAIPKWSITLQLPELPNTASEAASVDVGSEQGPAVQAGGELDRAASTPSHFEPLSGTMQSAADTELQLPAAQADYLPLPSSARQVDTAELALAKQQRPSTRTFPGQNYWLGGLLALWLCGAISLALRLAFAASRTQRILNSARAVPPHRLPIVNYPVSVVESAEVRAPAVTYYWFRPCVVLPLSWTDWPDHKQTAALYHEAAHVRRRDGLVQLLGEIATVLYWFHPLVWAVRRELSRLAELACDAEAASYSGDRLRYAQNLIEIASLNLRDDCLNSGIAMARGSQISQRVAVLIATSQPLAWRASSASVSTLFGLGVPAILLVAVISFSLRGSTPQVPKAETTHSSSTNDWLTEKDGQVTLHVRGHIVGPDGKPVEDCRVEVFVNDVYANTGRTLPVTVHHDTFEFDVQQSDNGLTIVVTNQDRSLQALKEIRREAARDAALKGVAIELGTPRRLRVRVAEADMPAPNAAVEITASRAKFLGRTDPNGYATLTIPKNARVDILAARTDDRRVAGKIIHRSKDADPLAGDYSLELVPCVPSRILVLDSEEQPVANLPFSIWSPAGADQGFMGPELVTDAQGEALLEWLPSWEGVKHYFNDLPQTGDWYVTESQFADNQLTVHVHTFEKRKRFRGRVVAPGGDVAGLLVDVSSFQYETEAESERLTARTNAQGEFEVRVRPGSTYCVYVNDAEMVSEPQQAILIDRETGLGKPLELLARQGEWVEVHFTQGSDHQPVENARVVASREIRYSWREPDEDLRWGITRFERWMATDANGKAAARFLPGPTTVRASLNDWEHSQVVNLTSGATNSIHVHRPTVGLRPIAGRIVLPEGLVDDLPAAALRVKTLDSATNFETTALADRDGNFHVDVKGERIALYARTQSGRAAGWGVVDVSELPLELKLTPTQTFRGQVFDQDGHPMTGHKFKAQARLKDTNNRKAIYSIGRDEYLGVGEFEAVTDEQGFFELQGLPANVAFILRSLDSQASSPDVDSRWHGVRILQDGENRPVEIIRIESGPTEKPTAHVPLRRRLDDLIWTAQENDALVMIAIYGSSDASQKFQRPLLSGATAPAASNYFFIRITPELLASHPAETEAFLAAHNWPKPDEAAIFLAALDPAGAESARLTVSIGAGEPATRQVAEFIAQNAPPQQDARAKWAAALAEAKATDRLVWVRNSQTRCYPCLKFSHWLDKHRRVLEKDFVLLKIDNVRDLHGQEVAEKLGANTFGVPFHAIYDAEGYKRCDSVSSLGNIGYPSGFEGNKHLREMLSSTTSRIAAEEIDAMIGDLKDE